MTGMVTEANGLRAKEEAALLGRLLLGRRK